MTLHIPSPLQIHVTGVTRVTTFAKRPDPLGFPSVTLMSNFPYTSCDAAQRCNARATPRLLRADLGCNRPRGVYRWKRLHDTGRGIEPNVTGHHQCP